MASPCWPGPTDGDIADMNEIERAVKNREGWLDGWFADRWGMVWGGCGKRKMIQGGAQCGGCGARETAWCVSCGACLGDGAREEHHGYTFMWSYL